jgi:hypothetical protein
LNAPTQTYGGSDEILRGGNRADRFGTTPPGGAEAKNIYVQRKDGILLPEYRLPTEAEWEYAALGLVGYKKL